MTLLELLIVLAIVAILTMLLVGAGSDIFDALRAAECQNNLRAIGSAYVQYLSESGGLWPPILTSEVPAAAVTRFSRDTGLLTAPARPAANWGQPGPHWSIVLWPYVNNLSAYTCPADPRAGLRGIEVTGAEREHSAALLDAPPESYALNVILFRTADDIRRKAGCTWGIRGGSDYNGMSMYTSMAEQQRQFGNTTGLVLFFCGASGQTVGSQFNIPFRTTGLVDRWEWHPRRAAAAFADDPGKGANYLFGNGRVEYRDALPSLAEWGYDLGDRAQP